MWQKHCWYTLLDLLVACFAWPLSRCRLLWAITGHIQLWLLLNFATSIGFCFYFLSLFVIDYCVHCYFDSWIFNWSLFSLNFAFTSLLFSRHKALRPKQSHVRARSGRSGAPVMLPAPSQRYPWHCTNLVAWKLYTMETVGFFAYTKW